MPFRNRRRLRDCRPRSGSTPRAVYVLDTANYHDLLILNGGVRYDDYNINTSGYGTGALATTRSVRSQAEFGMPNFNLGLTLKPLPNGSVYVAYATSSNPGRRRIRRHQHGLWRPCPCSCNGNPNQIFGPEKNKAIEVGTKWELFDRHLLVTAALFQTTKDNAREACNVISTATQTCPSRPQRTGTTVSCIIAGAAYHVRGIDLGVGGKITDKWSVFGGLVLMQSEVTQVAVPSAANRPLVASEQRRASARQRRASVLQHADQISDQRHLGNRRAGGVPLEDLRRHVARREPGHVDAELLALRRLRRGQDRQELEGEAVRQQHLRQASITTHCIRARRRSCWKRPVAPPIWCSRRGTDRKRC